LNAFMMIRKDIKYRSQQFTSSLPIQSRHRDEPSRIRHSGVRKSVSRLPNVPIDHLNAIAGSWKS
jgi:hypothetical protein